VLGSIAEESLHKAWALWGWEFFIRPLSLVLMSMIALTIIFAAWRGYKDKQEGAIHVVG
jgi:TctA family transporter